MPELRKDPVTSRWVIISTERGKRPSDFGPELERKKTGFCPFCPGNEDKTPSEVLAYRASGSPANGAGWHVRVVPNKFPALQIEGELNRQGDGMYDKMNGIGAHEVIIETPEHGETLASMSESRLEDILWAFRDRFLDLKKDLRFRYILIFKNYGEAAGASLEHPHSQLIATPIIPKRVQEELDGAKAYYNYKERCVFCDIVRQELNQGLRLISENEDFVAAAPFAARFPFETWILPKAHDAFFEDAQKREYVSLSKILRDVLLRVEKVLTNPPYNLIIHTAPLRETDGRYYHWHIELMPKLTRVAGFEWGSGFYINPTSPEEAAKFLRDVIV
ncbi:MAG TPA: galactose-1-phosphate uridylyltransferase [Candidatus Methylomirabilis sp.]|nr:galactose-1-phosphate uridylyltransferase [Candidatus Methylomirabilis sp.]